MMAIRQGRENHSTIALKGWTAVALAEQKVPLMSMITPHQFGWN
jgi:hypothetical protein